MINNSLNAKLDVGGCICLRKSKPHPVSFNIYFQCNDQVFIGFRVTKFYCRTTFITCLASGHHYKKYS